LRILFPVPALPRFRRVRACLYIALPTSLYVYPVQRIHKAIMASILDSSIFSGCGYCLSSEGMINSDKITEREELSWSVSRILRWI
jgi:hypothetical protein